MNEIERMKRWTKIADILQYTALAGLVFMAVFLNEIPYETASALVGYFAITVMIAAIVGVVAGYRATKLQQRYFSKHK